MYASDALSFLSLSSPFFLVVSVVARYDLTIAKYDFRVRGARQLPRADPADVIVSRDKRLLNVTGFSRVGKPERMSKPLSRISLYITTGIGSALRNDRKIALV